jgi:HEAT repeat protein
MIEDFNKGLEIRTREAQSDPRSTHDFISTVLTGPNEESAWDAIAMLHYRGTKEVFDAACRLCVSNCPQERTLGANILGQLGIPERSFPTESVDMLIQLLATEVHEEVLDAICVALGHLHDSKAVPALSRLKTHPCDKVRFAVVFGLLGLEAQLAIESLIQLSRDQDVDVRNWATFGLGTQIEADTVEIRAALFERICDEDEVTRGEAFVGLARRKAERIIEPLIKELERYPVAQWRHSVEAAEELGDARLLPVLRRLQQSTDSEDTTFDEAIRRCSKAIGNETD